MSGVRDWYRDFLPSSSSSSKGTPVLPREYIRASVPASNGQVIENDGIPVGSADALSVGNALRLVGPSSDGGVVSQNTSKALPRGVSPARGPRVRFYDPLALIYATGFRDRRFSLTYDTLRRTAHQLSLVGSIILLRVNQVAEFAQPYRDNKQVGFEIRFKDDLHLPSESERRHIQRLERFIMECGWEGNPYNIFKRDNFGTFLKKVSRDSLVYDQACWEIVPDDQGRPYEFHPVDASTIRLAATYDGHQGEKPRRFHMKDFSDRWKKEYGEDFSFDGETVFSVQVLHGRIENIFTHNDMAFCIRNPRSDLWVNGYGLAEIEVCLNTITRMLWAEEYNARAFRQGSMANGLLNFKGVQADPGQMEAFKREWAANVTGVENCLSGDTRVCTLSDGEVSIREVLGGAKEKYVALWDGDKWAPGRVFRTSEPKKLCEVRAERDVVISSSPDHRFMTINRSAEKEWKRQSELSVGDFLLGSLKVLCGPGDGEEGYVPLKVLSVEQTEELVQMYDVEMFTEEHQFIANGVVTHNSHRTPIVQVPEGIEFVNFQRGNKEMEYKAWLDYLLKIVSGAFQIDPAEINFDLVSGGGGKGGPIFESKHEWKIKYSKDKGLRPLLRFLAENISKYIVEPLDDRLYLDFVGLDQQTESDRLEMITRKASSYKTLNEVRAEEGLDPVEAGDIILNPIYAQAKQAADQQAMMGGKSSGKNPMSPWMTEEDVPDPEYGKAPAVPLILQEGPDDSVPAGGGPPPGPAPGGPPGMPPDGGVPPSGVM